MKKSIKKHLGRIKMNKPRVEGIIAANGYLVRRAKKQNQKPKKK